MPKLTKRVVEAAEPQGRDSFLWCDELPGFGVRIFASGRRSYLVQYRMAGRTRRVTIGLHGPVTTEQARKEALTLLGQVARGADPAEDRASNRAAMTVAELCAAYLAAADAGLIMGKGGRAKRASTLYVDRGRIERHITPLLGRRLVKDLQPSDVARFLRDVQAGKTAADVKTGLRGRAIVEGGAGTAARTAGLLGGILSYAVSEGIIPTNPATGVRRPADAKRTRRLTAAEYGALGRALDAMEAQAGRWQGVAAIRLLALTGCRRQEVNGLRWPEVDMDGCALRLTDTKEGGSVRPLGIAARRVLAGLPRLPREPWVFPAVRGSGPFGGLPGVVDRVMEAAGLDDVTAHTLRHSFASMAGDLGFSDATIGAMLGHAGGTMTSRYVHHLDAVLVSAADKVSKAIAAAMGGPPGAAESPSPAQAVEAVS
ncbi:tyrosine-type recombinase/integrase [Methylobacterium persicinum]|uniref:Integrase n=1 Tax=Methylobacterium persicinum TaxID=374426 RepID=A0ABU0HQG0_9HYPH|nr:site-specific integrase [Methylobacterium persicinum]MDQ0444548.1 integrase [Methylobacterium persicinum]GJE40444.1 Prophage integrase IntS [Methylobacterium persicinum]